MNSTTTSLFRLNSHLRGAASAIIVASSLALLPSAALGQIDSFMKIEGIKGDSTVQGHRDEINIIGFTMGVDRPVTYGASAKETIGMPSFFEVRVSKKIDATSPLLFVGCATGEAIPTVTLTLARPDGKGAGKKPFDFFKVVLSNVLITRVSTGGDAESGSGETQDEQIALSFQKIEWIYRSENAAGKVTEVKRGFDLGLNVPSTPPN